MWGVVLAAMTASVLRAPGGPYRTTVPSDNTRCRIGSLVQFGVSEPQRPQHHGLQVALLERGDLLELVVLAAGHPNRDLDDLGGDLRFLGADGSSLGGHFRSPVLCGGGVNSYHRVPGATTGPLHAHRFGERRDFGRDLFDHRLDQL